MKTRAILLCAAAVVSTAALAKDMNKSDAPVSGDVFKSLDTDGDGKISRSEAAADSKISDSFDKLDRNSDGFITKHEFRSNTMPKPKPG